MRQNGKFLFVFLVLSLFLSCAQAPQQLVSEKPVAPVVDLTSEKVRDSIVLIESENASGTGFFIAPNMVATNTHVVAHAGPVFVKSPDRKKDWTIEGVVGFDAKNSLVILKLTGESVPLPLVDRVQISESVSILSYPDGAFEVSESSIQSIRKNNRWLRLNKTTAKKTNGSPVFNNNGRVIGVVVPYGGYAVSSSVLEALLAASMPMEPLSAWHQRKQVRAAAYYSLGKEKFGAKDYADAIVNFDKAIELDPTYVRAYYERGRAQDRLGVYDSAIASCAQVLEMDPDEADAYYGRGTIKAKLGDYADAIIDLDKAIELDAQHAEAYSNRGGIKYGLGGAESARGNAEAARRLYESAIADCNKAIEIDPEDANTYNFRAAAKLVLGDLEGAIFDLNRTIEITPKHVDAYNNRGWVQFRFGESETARGNIDKAQELYKAAIEDFTQVLKLAPEDLLAYNNRGLTQLRLGESKSAHSKVSEARVLYEAAIADYTQSIKINPKDGNIYYNRATVKCKLGDIESKRGGDAEKAQRLYHEGITDYDKAIQLDNPEDTDAKTANLESKKGRDSTVRVMTWTGNFSNGSGFFVDKDKIVTNIHVVAQPGPVFVTLSDKEAVWTVEGVTAYDAENDLAILKIVGEGSPLVLGNSDLIQIGESVVAIGYPGGRYKVTAGVIDRIQTGGKLIRTKVETAEGNSGGPLLNSKGQVIGINAAGGKPYGYAIPSNALRALIVQGTAEPLVEWRQRDSIRAHVYHVQGQWKFRSNRFNEALADFDKAIQLNPAFIYTYRWRGDANSRLGNHKAAIADYNTAIQLDPDNADSYRGRGMAKVNLGDPTGAVLDCNKAVQINPEDVHAYSIRGWAQFLLGISESAGGDMEKAQVLYGAAINDYTQATKIDSKFAGAYMNRAKVKFRLGQSKAIQGNIIETLQLYESVVEDCSQAIQLAPGDANAYGDRGGTKLAIGELESTRGNTEKAQNSYEAAIEDLTQAVKITPKFAYAYKNLGKAKFRLGESKSSHGNAEKVEKLYEASIEDLTQAIKLVPEYAEAYYWRGKSKETLGQEEAAQADFQKAKGLDPNVGK